MTEEKKKEECEEGTCGEGICDNCLEDYVQSRVLFESLLDLRFKLENASRNQVDNIIDFLEGCLEGECTELETDMFMDLKDCLEERQENHLYQDEN